MDLLIYIFQQLSHSILFLILRPSDWIPDREKLEAYNKMVMDISGDESKKKNFKSFVDDVWKECMANSDNCLKTADKPKKDGGKKAADK